MSYELTGTIKLIEDEQVFDSGFRKRGIVVTVDGDGKYPQDISLEFVQTRAALLENFSVGQEVTVSFNLRGREYKGRYFNSLNGWNISPLVSTKESAAEPSFAPPSALAGNPFDDDAIPF